MAMDEVGTRWWVDAEALGRMLVAGARSAPGGAEGEVWAYLLAVAIWRVALRGRIAPVRVAAGTMLQEIDDLATLCAPPRPAPLPPGLDPAAMSELDQTDLTEAIRAVVRTHHGDLTDVVSGTAAREIAPPPRELTRLEREIVYRSHGTTVGQIIMTRRWRRELDHRAALVPYHRETFTWAATAAIADDLRHAQAEGGWRLSDAERKVVRLLYQCSPDWIHLTECPLVGQSLHTRLGRLARLGGALTLAQSVPGALDGRLYELLAAARIPADWATSLYRSLEATGDPDQWRAERPDLDQLLADAERQLGAIGRYLANLAVD